MNRFAQAGAFALLLAAAALQAGCSNSSAGLATGGVMPADAPAAVGLSNDNPMARPVGVAWTSARAKRCAFYFDPAKLRTTYLSYEGRQGAGGEQYAKIEKAYDTTYRVTLEKTVGDPDYCSERKGGEIKADLERHRDYLHLVARMQLPPNARPDLDASGLVQQTLLEGHRDRERLRGRTDGEVLAFLRRALRNNVLDAVRKKRPACAAAAENSSVRLESWLAADQSSPSECASSTRQRHASRSTRWARSCRRLRARR